MSPPVQKILARLEKLYPKAKSALDFKTPLEALIAAMLAAQCTDKRVNEVTATLFKNYRKAEDYVRVPLERFQKEISRIHFYRNKAHNIQKCCRILLEKYGGQVPKTLEAMLELPGVGRKTANMVLGNSYDIFGIIVDTHVIRVAFRLGLTREKKPEKIEADLMKLVPKPRWTLFSHQLSSHGRIICKAPTPLCPQCDLNSLCPKNGVTRAI
ncbi:MAG TPA: endonuclease III [Deltaproteobacteria bacterium]|nr:endonuclease III [Deltaproteobacteria bacterium]